MTVVSTDPYAYSQEELNQLVTLMRRVADTTYWLFYAAEMGGRCHAFLEFNGLIHKYVDIAARAAEQGIDFTQANTHSGEALPVEEHDLAYLAEKLRCIFGPIIDANPSAKRLMKEILFNEEEDAR